MKSKQGQVSNVRRKERGNGDPYLVVSIDGTKFTVFKEELFDDFTEGKNINVKYEENSKNNTTYRNIQSLETSDHKLEVKIQALEQAVAFAPDDAKSTDVIEVAKNFAKFLQ